MPPFDGLVLSACADSRMVVTKENVHYFNKPRNNSQEVTTRTLTNGPHKLHSISSSILHNL
jgi:hypothetical protein